MFDGASGPLAHSNASGFDSEEEPKELVLWTLNW
jgi:hypothetical protein